MYYVDKLIDVLKRREATTGSKSDAVEAVKNIVEFSAGLNKKARLDGIIAFEIERVKKPTATTYSFPIPIKFNKKEEMSNIEVRYSEALDKFEKRANDQLLFFNIYLHRRYPQQYYSILFNKGSNNNIQVTINKK